MKKRKTIEHFVVCLSNEGFEVSLEPLKIYVVLKDEVAAKHGHVRVVDESHEDYLYPKKLFAEIALSPQLARAVAAAAA